MVMVVWFPGAKDFKEADDKGMELITSHLRLILSKYNIVNESNSVLA